VDGRVEGFVEPRFARVRDAFAANFAAGGEVGAACSVYHRGRPVVDLWGGLADREAGRPWARDTAAVVFSTTKGLTALCALRCVERGLLDPDAPVAAYWPEFAAAGKGDVLVRWVLSHRAGLPVVDGEFTPATALAWEPVVAALARQAPAWRPGTRHGYHLRSFGWLVGELVRRVSGRTLGRFFAEEIAAPLGLDFWIGLPAELEPRLATLYPPPSDVADLVERDGLLWHALTGPSDLFRYDGRWNRRELHAAELPSSNGIGTARAIARCWAAVIGDVDGVRLLRPETVAAACVVQSDGPDAVLVLPTRFGLGVMLPPALSLAAGPRALGHPGAGGSLGLADPDAEIGFGYVMNQMAVGVTGDRRAQDLLEAVYAAL
jgi:CubicO group peptidase (beta-lactamase class C family)